MTVPHVLWPLLTPRVLVGWGDSPTTATCWRRRALQASRLHTALSLPCMAPPLALFLLQKPNLRKTLKSLRSPLPRDLHIVFPLVHRHRADDACDKTVTNSGRPATIPVFVGAPSRSGASSLTSSGSPKAAPVRRRSGAGASLGHLAPL